MTAGCPQARSASSPMAAPTDEKESLMHRELSRKRFIKGSGAVVAGLSVAGTASAAGVVEATGNTPFSERTPADYIALGDPRLTQVDTWLAITPANKVIVTHGETE